MLNAINAFNIQQILKTAGLYDGEVDGDIGPKTIAAIEKTKDKPPNWGSWSVSRKGIAALQTIVKAAGFVSVGTIDGLDGYNTRFAFGEWLDGSKRPLWRPDDTPTTQIDFGTQRNVEKTFGKAGGIQCTAGVVELPYLMSLAWDKSVKIERFRCHELIAPAFTKLFKLISETHTSNEIETLGINLFGGCYNFRPMRGGRNLSMHAYGLAIDLDPERNQLKWNRKRARLAQPDATKFWGCVADAGLIGLGPRFDFDWMHIQGPRV
jgi:hypothetical protein